MSNKIVLLTIAMSLLVLGGMGAAVITSYGRIIGYATLNKAMEIDIIGSSNDTFYSLNAYQGESVYSPKIKLVNKASVPVNITVNVTLLSSPSSGISFSVWDDNKTAVLENPISVSPEDLYIYILHEFGQDATPGNYSFQIDVAPVQ